MGKDLSKFRGCLLGGAAGDALGYAVEFMSAEEIFIKYGENGITSFELTDGKAFVSDDTQMTLFTANGLLHGSTMQQIGGPFESYSASVALAYRDWLRTQGVRSSTGSICWLNNIPAINSTRAPGSTCLSALRSGIRGTVASHVNDSKGCGGVMRVAPVGLYLQSLGFSLYDSDMIAAEAAAVTHGHPLGYMPAAALAQIIGYAVNMPGSPLLYSVMSAKHALGKLFPDEPELPVMTGLIDKAIELSLMDMDDLDAIRQLGAGWTGEECLAIAIYCSLKYSDDFEDAVIASVNHDGDSDSTGAVTGNILGAYLGDSAIPSKFLENLELRDVITEIADDLCNDCPISYDDVMDDAVWVSKYIDHDYVPGKTEENAEPETVGPETPKPENGEPVRAIQMQLDLGLFTAESNKVREKDTVPEPDEIREPAEVQAPKIAETIRSEEIPEPAEISKLAEAPKPAVISKPAEAPKPSVTSKPAEAPEPAEIPKPSEKTQPAPKPKAKPRTKEAPAPKITPLKFEKLKPKAKPEQAAAPIPKAKAAPKKTAAEEPAERAPEVLQKPESPGIARFYRWTDVSFGGYDVLMVCDKNAYLNLCISFAGCRLDALCEGGKYFFLVDSSWEEFTPLRRAEYLHPEGTESPQGEALRKFKFNPQTYSFRVYTDKELRK